MKFLKLSLLLLVIALISGCTTGKYGGQGTTPPPSANVLNGQYAFVLSGFDAASHPMGIAGSITADGFGHITGGSVDVNDNQVISSSTGALAGSYSLDSNFRGVITLTNPVGSVTHPLAFAFTLKTNGTAGNMIAIDTNNFVLSGTMQKQDATAFSLAKLAGDFAFEVDSRAPTQRSGIGRFTLGLTGTSTNVVWDASVSGGGTTGPLTAGSVAVTFTTAGPNGNGRGTMSLTDNHNLSANFVYYVVDAGTLLPMETDAAGGAAQSIFTGVANKQNTPFSAANVNTAASVFALSGFDTPSPNDISAVGVLQITGSNTASLRWDTDDVGAIFSQTQSGLAVTFDQSTGRGTITVTGGAPIGLFDAAVFYLTDSGKGFLLDATAGTSNRALAGRLQAQTGSGSFGPSTLSGNKIVRQTGTSVHDDGALDGLVSDIANNNVLTETVTIDFRNLAVTNLNRTGSGSLTVTIDANTGRGVQTGSSGGLTFTNVFYLIGQNQYVLVDETPASNNTIPIGFADPQ